MAGVAITIAKSRSRPGYLGMIQDYGAAGIVSAGPWIASILGVFAIGVLSRNGGAPGKALQDFQISVTYLMVFSFLMISPIQLPFTRFLGDRIHGGRHADLFGNIIGVLTLGAAVSGALGHLAVFTFEEVSRAYRWLMVSGAAILSGIWLAMAILSSLRRYGTIVLAFLVGHIISAAIAFNLGGQGVEGLLLGYLIGQGLLLLILLSATLFGFPFDSAIQFEFLRRGHFQARLAVIGILFAVAVWVDKLLFWFNPATSIPVLGPLRVSDIYDLPIFLAYLFILPGMASFLRFTETVFAEKHRAFYDSISHGASLKAIVQRRDEMVDAIREGLVEIFKVQFVTVAVVMANAEWLLNLVGISPVYRMLLNIDLVAVSVQVLLLALFSILSYLDLQGEMIFIGFLFLSSNLCLTLLSQYLGPNYYGYGFAASLALTVAIGFFLLSRRMDRLVYRTFMLQKTLI